MVNLLRYIFLIVGAFLGLYALDYARKKIGEHGVDEKLKKAFNDMIDRSTRDGEGNDSSKPK